MIIKTRYLLLLFFSVAVEAHFITNGGTLQLGDNICGVVLAKILSLKYNLTFYYKNFWHAELFILEKEEKKYDNQPFDTVVRVQNESDILNNINKGGEIFFYTDILTKIDTIDPSWVLQVKHLVQLQEIPPVQDLPHDIITVAVHIRKGNGGGQFYDGEQSSLQYFDFDRSMVRYAYDQYIYPFEWHLYAQRNEVVLTDMVKHWKTMLPSDQHSIDQLQKLSINLNKRSLHTPVCASNKTPFESTPITKDRLVLTDTVGDWQTKFPPNQYYVDQLQKLSTDLNNPPLYIQIFTDDKDPISLVQTIRKKVNRPNLIFYHEDNRNLPYKERIAKDLYSMSQSDILIRSQSYFPRIAELMGNHKLVISSRGCRWQGNKLIMDTIVVHGHLH